MCELTFFIPELAFLDRLMRREHVAELFAKVVDNVQIGLLVTEYLDVGSVLKLLLVLRALPRSTGKR